MGFFSRGTLALLAGCGGAASIAPSRLQMLKALESRSPWVRLGAHVRLEDDAYGGCGVVVRGGAVAAGAALVSVDAPLFAPGGAAGDVGARAAAAVGAGPSDADVFAICAAMRGAETDDEARWAPYRAALPWASLRESHPLHWSDADIAAAAPPGGAARVAALRGLADALEDAAGRAPLATAVEAVACGVSRAIRAPQSKRVCAAPFLELINHDAAGANCAFREDDAGALVAVATRDVRDGESVLVDYGDDERGDPKTPDILFAAYGIR